MGYKPIAAIFLMSMFALPVGCGDDDDGGPEGGKGGVAGKGGSAGTGAKAGKGGTSGSGTSGGPTDAGAGGVPSTDAGAGGVPSTDAGAGGVPSTDAGAGGLPSTDAGAGGNPEVGGSGGDAAGSDAGGQGGSDAGPTVTVEEQINALKASICAREPGGSPCAMGNGTCASNLDFFDAQTNSANPEACDAAFKEFLECMDGRPLSEYTCDNLNGLDYAGANVACEDQASAQLAACPEVVLPEL